MIHSLILKLTDAPDDGDRIKEAAAALREGKTVVFPTETVYGIGCNAAIREAVERLYEIKGRSRGKPLAFYVGSGEGVLQFMDKPLLLAERAMERFWPGPLTLILPAGEGGEGRGFRCPDDKNALALIAEAGVPLVATSANLSGGLPPKCGEDAAEAMEGMADVILKGGRTRYRRESSILDLSGSTPRLLREGVIAAREIEEALGINIAGK